MVFGNTKIKKRASKIFRRENDIQKCPKIESLLNTLNVRDGVENKQSTSVQMSRTIDNS